MSASAKLNKVLFGGEKKDLASFRMKKAGGAIITLIRDEVDGT